VQAEVEQSLGGLAQTVWEEGAVNKKLGVPRDHFGYADNISQPVFFVNEGRKPGWTSTWDPAAWPNLVLAPEPSAADPEEPGSYMAFLKIRQNIAAFNELVASVASAAGAKPEDVKGWIMGRTPDGDPLTKRGLDRNDFDFSADAPVTVARWPRLLFQCFQSSLAVGFEHIFRHWALDEHHPRRDAGLDPILACQPSPPVSVGRVVRAIRPMQSLTAIEYGEYFYFPSIPFFKRLAP
jgi:hypothetical protein